MNNLDHFLQRNEEFAVQQSAAGTLMPWLPRALPGVKAIIIGCADMRVDPAHILGTKPGEAVVLRNIGGRITPGLLEQLSLLGRIGEVAGEIPGGGGEFHFIVLQHTDCGITRLAGDPAILMSWLSILTELIGGLAVLLGALIPLVSLPMAGLLFVAIFTVHLPYGFASIKLLSVADGRAQFGPPGYEVALLYLACLAALVIGGSGPMAIDEYLRKKAAP